MVSMMNQEKAEAIAKANNDAEEKELLPWKFEPVPVEGNDAGLWVVRVYDEAGNVLGHL